jgi:hypothetical protein
MTENIGNEEPPEKQFGSASRVVVNHSMKFTESRFQSIHYYCQWQDKHTH